MTTPADPPSSRDTLRIAFLALGAVFFGIGVLDRVLSLLVGFSSLLLTIFLTWLLAFLISPLVSSLDRRLHLGRGLAVAVAYGAVAGSVLAVFGTLFIIVVLSLYAVADPEAITGTIRRIVPNRHADTLLLVQRTVGRAFRGFLRTQVVLVLVQIGLTLVLGLIFGLPYLFLLTVSTGVLMFIPFFGPPLALIPIVFVALAFRQDVALLVIVTLVITQTILVNAIQPRLLRERVGLHPILVIVALLVGSQVAGLWGAIFGIPFVAIVNLLLRYIIDSRAVNEVEGIELEEVVAEIQAENPEVHVEEAVAIAADRAEAMLETDAAVEEP